MKKKTSNSWIYILLAVGVLLLNYPGASNLYNRLHEASIISDYDAALDQVNEAELQKARTAARAYNARIAKQGVVTVQDAFAAAEKNDDQEYQGLLNVNGDQVMGYIEIPKINVYMVIYHGTSAEVLEKGAGHMEGTSLPVGGADTHAVITGHRGLPSAELFTNLDELSENDELYLHVLNETLAYRIDQIDVILPEEIQSLSIEDGEDYVTLVTCTPYGINSHRLLIRGTRIPYEKETKDRIGQVIESVWQWLLEQKILLSSMILIFVIIVISVGKAIRKGSHLIRRN